MQYENDVYHLVYKPLFDFAAAALFRLGTQLNRNRRRVGGAASLPLFLSFVPSKAFLFGRRLTVDL